MHEASAKPQKYAEYLRAPGWMFGILGLLLGIDSGILTAVAIRSFGSDPWLEAAEATLFFISFGLGMAVIVYVMLNFTTMTVAVQGGELIVTMGMLGRRRSWRLDNLSNAKVTQHSLTRHGGRGNIFAPNSRRSWAMFGVQHGVEFEYPDAKGAIRVYFVPSRRPAELATVLSREDE